MRQKGECFNSATASPPWMTRPIQPPLTIPDCWLQFGHSVAAVDDDVLEVSPLSRTTRFNSATASPPWMTYRLSGSIRFQGGLQFGHSVAAVDDIPTTEYTPFRRLASIRPQRRRRG